MRKPDIRLKHPSELNWIIGYVSLFLTPFSWQRCPDKPLPGQRNSSAVDHWRRSIVIPGHCSYSNLIKSQQRYEHENKYTHRQTDTGSITHTYGEVLPTWKPSPIQQVAVFPLIFIYFLIFSCLDFFIGLRPGMTPLKRSDKHNSTKG